MSELLMLVRRVMVNPLHSWVLLLMVLLATGFAGSSLIFEHLQMTWLSNFMQGVSTNMIGALLIFLLIELFWGEAKELQQLHEELRSSNNLIALGALEKARIKGILQDGSLHRAAFWNANWEGANLSGAQLNGASFVGANLKGANLRDANIKGVDFSWAQFDKNSILPNGLYWQSDQDLE